MQYKVLQSFYDAKSMGLVPSGSLVDWDDKERIKAALDRGLIAEIEKPKPAPAPAKKRTTATKKK